jgi:hypothetical protein
MDQIPQLTDTTSTGTIALAEPQGSFANAIVPEVSAPQVVADSVKPEATLFSVASAYDSAPAITSDVVSDALPVLSVYQKANERFKTSFANDDDVIGEIDVLRKQKEELDGKLSQKSAYEYGSQILQAADHFQRTGAQPQAVREFLDFANSSFFDKNPDGSFVRSNEDIIRNSFETYCRENGIQFTQETYEQHLKDSFGTWDQEMMETRVNRYKLTDAAKTQRAEYERMRQEYVKERLDLANAGRAEKDKERGKKQALHTNYIKSYADYAKTAPDTIENIKVTGIEKMRASILQRLDDATLLQSWLAPKGVVDPLQLKQLEIAELIMNPAYGLAEKSKLIQQIFTGILGAQAQELKAQMLTTALSSAAQNTTDQRGNASVNYIEPDQIKSMGPLVISKGAFDSITRKI